MEKGVLGQLSLRCCWTFVGNGRADLVGFASKQLPEVRFDLATNITGIEEHCLVLALVILD